jgi:enolase-phosphatase E1
LGNAAAVRAVVTDIEGTTTPIRFVHDVLFPYARARLPALLAERAADAEVAAALARVREAAPGADPIETLTLWQDADLKAEPLKTLQGIAWRDGYRSGALRGELYPDVPSALRRWHAGGLGLAVYSSGSVEAQRLLFGHAAAGDLAGLFGGFFDTTTGPKREATSYARIAAALGLPPATILFLSDVGAELDAAVEAGFATCQLLRPGDGAEPARGHAQAADFDAVARLHGLA